MVNTIAFLCNTCNNSISLPAYSTNASVCCTNCGRTYPSQDGILMLDSAGNQEDYPNDVYALLAEIEPKHFWFNGRNKLIIWVMQKAIGSLNNRLVLDIGCGTGYVLAALEQAGMITYGLDMHLVGLRYARARAQGNLLCLSATRIPFTGQFDIVTLCDVIEHTPDDSVILREASHAVKEGGAIVVTVPADPHLWTVVDDASGHKRRYTKQSLRQAMERSGLRVVLIHYFNILLLPVQKFQRRLLRHQSATTPETRLQLFRQSLHVPAYALNKLFSVAMAADIPLSRFSFPVGASLIAIGTRL